MTVMKRLSTSLFCLLLIALFLVACGGQEPAATSAPAPGPDDANVEEPEDAAEEAAGDEQAEPEAAGDGRLVYLSWAGYEIPEFWGQFAEQYPDVEVDYAFLTESAEVYSRLQTGFEADIVHPCSNLWGLLVEEGLMQPIDASKLENWAGVVPSLAAEGEFDGQQYFVPWDWGFESILVRTDLVDEVPTSWADVWDDQYAGHIAINDSGEAAHVFTSLALGFDPWETTPEQEEEVRQKLLELAPNVLAYWSGQTELDQMLASGDAWLGVGAWNASYIGLLNEGYEVEYIVPEEGRTGFLCGLGIPATSTNVDLAHAMIDAYLAVDSMAYLANEYGYGVSNADAIPAIDPEMADLLGLNDVSTLDETVFYEYMTDEQRELWTNVWSEVKTSQ